jgi:hypothetical protein
MYAIPITRCVSAALAAVFLLPAAAKAQVNPFGGGRGLSPEDHQLLFERVARLNAAEPASPVAAAQPVPVQTIRRSGRRNRMLR